MVEIHSGLDLPTISCSNNKVDGTAWPTRCAPDLAPVASFVPEAGATLRCAKNGALLANLPDK